MNHLNKLTWITLFSIAFCVSALADGPKVGEPPPLLQAAELIQAPPGAKMDADSLRGKVVILEFWATWCGPCVAAIPHLNELAEKFKDRPVEFIAITAEDEATVEKFLAKRPIKAWVALDTNNAMSHAYAVTAIPHTVVLDKNGKIAAITYPTELTEKHINDLLAGKKISLATEGGATVPAEKGAPPLFQVLIQPSAYTNTLGFSSGSGRMTAIGYTVEGIMPMIYDTSYDRVITNAPMPSGHFNFTVIQPRDSDTDPDTLMQEAVKLAFGLTAKRQTNQMNAFVLKVQKTNAPGLIASPTKSMSWHSGLGSMGGVGVSIQSIASFLESALKTPVVDETGLTNSYGYDVSLEWEQESWNKPNPDALKKAVREQLGLELVPDRRPIEMLVIEQMKKNEPEKKH
jgi:uncharacterized protein (TIGR03435 family)